MEESVPYERRLSALFPIAAFLGAFLLFQIQPILGRYVLPRFGGGPSVWTTCMLFFQLLLVAGYAWAHFVGSLRSRVAQVCVHSAALFLSLLFFPITRIAGSWKMSAAIVSATTGDPSLEILLLLAASIGGPYLMLSATAPLIQRWFSLSYSLRSPWRLYALSNAGSLIALLTYPFLVEPYLRLQTQTSVWTVLYCAFVAVSIGAALRLRSAPSESEPVGDRIDRPSAVDVLLWFGFAAAGSTLLLSTTNQLSERIAAAPFLWVAPLSIYLITFILTFDNDRWYRHSVFGVASGVVAAIACIMLVTRGNSLPLRQQLGAYLATMFVLCMTCHGELAHSRPAARYLTAYYLSIAGGGALGGVFVAIVAPRVFTSFTEYPIALAAACCLVFANWLRAGALRLWTSRNLAVRIPLMALLIGTITSSMTIRKQDREQVRTRVRNFYAILRVIDTPSDRGVIRELDHGPIRHGFQYLRSDYHDWPTSYYGPNSGIGTVLSALHKPRRVAVIGLGAGSLAAWGRQGDTFPSMRSILRSSRLRKRGFRS